MWWMRENHDDKQWFSVRAKLEVPPKGYKGSLAGTGWDDDVILSEYDQASGSVNRGKTLGE